MVRAMSVSPQAPCELGGEGMVALVGGRRFRPALPPGLARLPGPTVVLGASCAGAQLGAFRVLAVAVTARRGARVGLYVARFVVDDGDARVAGACRWGLPAELGTLEWHAGHDATGLLWREGGITIQAPAPARRLVPVSLPLWLLQQRSDGLVSVQVRLRGWARPTGVRVEVHGASTAAAGLEGRHLGATMSGLCAVLRPARRLAGMPVSGRVSLGAPDAARCAAGPTRVTS